MFLRPALMHSLRSCRRQGTAALEHLGYQRHVVLIGGESAPWTADEVDHDKAHFVSGTRYQQQ